MMRTTWRDEQHPSFVDFISSFLSANSIRLNFVPIAPVYMNGFAFLLCIIGFSLNLVAFVGLYFQLWGRFRGIHISHELGFQVLFTNVQQVTPRCCPFGPSCLA